MLSPVRSPARQVELDRLSSCVSTVVTHNRQNELILDAMSFSSDTR
jgi:hypothetical protein